MKQNKWVHYFLYGLFLLAYIIFCQMWLEYLNVQGKKTFVILPFEIWSTIIYSVGGVLLGLEKFISEVKKKGSWKVNWPKVIFLGIPSIYLALGIFIGYLPYSIRGILWHPFSLLYFSEIDLIPIFQLAFGYILITSFNKVKK